MSEKIVQLNEEVIKSQLKELVRGSVEETLNELLEQEAEKLTQAARYERNEARQGYRSGHYDRNLTTTSGDVTLHVPRLKGVSFETAIIERYRRRESSVEEALIEMYLAGVSVRRVEDITEALWGSKVSPATISELNKKAYVHIEDWRNRPLQGGKYPYVYVDGIYLRRNWGGEYENVAILVAIAVNEDGYREVLGAAEGMKEDKASWVNFFQWLKGRGLDGVKLIVGDKCLGMLEAVGEVFPDAKYQRCTVHFYRNVFSVVPRSKVKLVAKMLKAIHAQESKKAAREKAKAVVAQLKEMKLKEAAKKVEDSVEETLTYCDFPYEHWTRIRTNNVIERLNREIRRRTRVVGTFPDGNSALMLVCARLRHVAGTQNLTKTVLIHGDCHQNRHIFILSAPVAVQVDAVHVDVWIAPALQGAVSPVLDVNVGFLVQFADGGGRDLAAPQCLRDVLHPAHGDACQIHLDEGFLHAALPAAIPLDDGSFEGYALEPGDVERNVTGGRGKAAVIVTAAVALTGLAALVAGGLGQ